LIRWLWFGVARDAGFQVYDVQIRPAILEFGNRFAPRIPEVDGPRQRPVRVLGKRDVFVRRRNIRFVKRRLARPRQQLVDAAPGHHVAA